MTMLRKILIPLFLFTTSIAFSQEEPDVEKSLFNYFYAMGDFIPTIKIETDLKELIKQKEKEEYQPGTFTFLMGEKEIVIPVEVRARGNVRKKVCYFPPLKIDFKKGELKALGFTNMDKLKTVIQCKSGKAAESHVFKENLLYEIYNVLDTNGIRTKLVNFELWSNGTLEKSLSGFLIEHEKEYTARIKGKIVKANKLQEAAMERAPYLKMVFFQYMIANTDWAIGNKHNIEMVAVPNAKLVTPIPYDFDYSGFVGTGYAVVSESFPIKKVSERYFRGKKVTEAEATQTAEFYLAHKEKIQNVCEAATYLDEKTMKNVNFYIDSFYKEIEKPRFVKSKFVTN